MRGVPQRVRPRIYSGTVPGCFKVGRGIVELTMAHNITSSDRIVLAGKPAWHGLGTVLPEAPTPTEALRLGGFDWTVDQWPMVAVGDGGRRVASDTLANVRLVDGEPVILGEVGPGYRIVQNSELASIAEALASEGDTVRVESAGTLEQGRRVWFLLRGQSFSVRKDELVPYYLLANAHDGTMALRAIPTSVRVVCRNTWNASGVARSAAGYSFRHTSGIGVRVDEIRAALNLYGQSVEAMRAAAEALAAKPVGRDSLAEFWLEVYSKHWGAIPSNPTSDEDRRARDRAGEAFASIAQRFDRESAASGANAWTAANAYTGWLQHDRPRRAADATARAHARLIGADAERTAEAFTLAAAAF